MALQAGDRLGSYEIRGPLGAGGMGEVYRAWDARLGREVAVKVLPETAVQDPERLRRFEQEAKAAGALNHPNVLAVYDVGSHEGAPYLVSELLEGDTLRTQISAGGLTPRKAVEHGVQIARGLSAAHQRGIVHRDLKPENVFVTRDGYVKILDFGLAKLREDGRSDPESETETHQTRPGVILGTIPYLSPEQVRGLPADARSDIFALGSVLYEMLARRRAFTGETASEIETAILRAEPPELTSIDRGVSPATDRIVRRCLEKRPEDRFQTAQDVAFALEAVGVGVTTSSPQLADARRGWRLRAPLALLAALLLGLAIGAGLLAALRRPAPQPSYTQLTFRRGAVLSARFAPDGQTVVYSAAWDGQPAQVFTTRIGSRESRALDLEGTVLSVSSQGEVAVKRGRFLGRFGAGKGEPGTLARVSLAGGAPRDLLDDVTAADWDPEGHDLAVVHKGRLEYPIGRVVSAPDANVFAVRTLPGGRFAIVEDQPRDREEAPYRFRISLVDRAGQATVVSPGWSSWWDLSWSLKTQELFFVASDQVLRSVNLGGRQRVMARLPVGLAVLDVDPQGRLLLERRLHRSSVVALLPDESRERDLSLLDTTGVGDISADGRLLVLGEDDGSGTEVAYLRRTDGSPAVRLGEVSGYSLSPDGRFVLGFPGGESVRDHLILVPTGAGERRELRHPSIREFAVGGAWFPDGRRIAFVGEGHGQEGPRLFVWDFETSVPPRPLSAQGEVSWIGWRVVSPDGRWVAATAAVGSGLTLYPVDGGPARTLPGGSPRDEPMRWSAEGRWIYVRRDRGLKKSGAQAWIDRIEVATGKRESWKVLTPADPAGVYYISLAHITPDGKSYAYSIHSSIETLYLAEGLQ